MVAEVKGIHQSITCISGLAPHKKQCGPSCPTRGGTTPSSCSPQGYKTSASARSSGLVPRQFALHSSHNFCIVLSRWVFFAFTDSGKQPS